MMSFGLTLPFTLGLNISIIRFGSILFSALIKISVARTQSFNLNFAFSKYQNHSYGLCIIEASFLDLFFLFNCGRAKSE